jgi:class 3 adenylate cyclase/TolB-like protein/tetratricopeptide (TPR) repeat protein
VARDHRRLAAIVSADVAGYSLLMGRDDSATLAGLKAHRQELIDPKIAEYGGRIVKTTGDGLLLEFPSVVDSVRCAVDVQRGMAERNAGVPVEQRIEFRIGINVGDIIIDGDDIFGDGVNVAVRLEALADPGGICVSRVVRDQVLDKLNFGFEDLGAQEVKNIARPVEVYRVDLASEALQSPGRGRRRRLMRTLGSRWFTGGVVALGLVGIAVWVLPQFEKTSPAPAPPPLSIAILPFAAPAGSTADEQFADAVTRDLTTALGRWRIAKVASLGLAASYKGKPFDPRSIGRELNVLYLVEGDVGSAGEKVTVNTRLVDAGTGTQAWTVQQELSRSQVARGAGESAAWLASRLLTGVYNAEKQRAARLQKADATPLDLVLQADASLDKDHSPKGLLEARKLLDDVLRRDPDFLPAIMSHARIDVNELFGAYGTTPEGERFERILNEADALTTRAVALAPDYAKAWDNRTDVFSKQQRWDPALETNAVSLRLDSSNPNTYTMRALLLLWSGQAAASLPLTENALVLDPSNAGQLLMIQCHVYLMLGRLDDAIVACEKSIGQYDLWLVYVYLDAAYAQKGETNKAAVAKAELLKRKPKLSIESLRAEMQTWSNHPIFQKQTEETVLAGLRKAGIPER